MKATAKNVGELAERKQQENLELREYVKNQDRLSEREMDQLVFDISQRVWAGFDCATCGNCCKEVGTGVTSAEAQRLAQRLGLSAEEFRGRYLEPAEEPEEDEPPWQIRDRPCPFLKGNRCTVHEDRPAQCRGYP